MESTAAKPRPFPTNGFVSIANLSAMVCAIILVAIMVAVARDGALPADKSCSNITA